MADFATLVLGAETKGLKTAEPALDAVIAKAGKAEAATKKLETATKGMSDGAAQGAAGLKKTAAALEEVEAEARAAEVMLERTDRAAQGVGAGMSAGGQNSRMMAMQLSQVAQQASATGNWVQALAIQLPDMAMGFGAVGIAAGVLASVTLPLLASMFGSTADQAEVLKEKTEALKTVTEAYRATAEAAGAPIDALRDKYGALAMVAAIALNNEAERQKAESMAALSAQVDVLANSFGSLYQQEVNIGGMVGSIIPAVQELQVQFNFTERAAAQFLGLLRDLESAEGPIATAEAARALREWLEQAYGSADKMPPKMQEIYGALNDSTIAAAELQGVLDLVAGSADKVDQVAAQINRTIASADGSALQAAFASAFPVANQLLGIANAINAAMGKASSFKSAQTSQLAAQYQSYGEGRVIGERLARESGDLYGGESVLPVKPGRGGGGGGGGGGGRSAAAAEAEKEAAAIQKVVDNLKAEIEQVGQSEAARRLHQELQKAGVDIYSEEGQQIAALVEQLTELEAKQKLVAETMKGIENAAQGFFVGVLSGAKDLETAIGDLLKQLGNLFLNQAFKMLWEGKPGGSGGLGGLIAGLFDAGGHIPAGQIGVVAEKRPELVDGKLVTRPTLVSGPADVTGGSATAKMMGVPSPQIGARRQSAPMPQPRINVAAAPVQVVVLDDPRKIDAWMRSPEGERSAARQQRRLGNG